MKKKKKKAKNETLGELLQQMKDVGIRRRRKRGNGPAKSEKQR